MRGGSHGDWNRFLCSQILGAERDTMLLGSRQPSVSSSNPTKTTPGGMLPGGVAVVVAASPGTARAGLGHGARSRAPTPAPAASCSDGAAARGPVQATTGVGLRPGGRRRRSRSLGEVRGPYWRTPARRPWTRSGPWPKGKCAAARHVRVRCSKGTDQQGTLARSRVRQEGRACHGTRPPGPVQPRGKRIGDGGRSCPGKLLAAPIRGLATKVLPFPTPVRHRHVPENRDRGGCTPSPAWRLLARSTRGPAARSRPGGAGRY